MADAVFKSKCRMCPQWSKYLTKCGRCDKRWIFILQYFSPACIVSYLHNRIIIIYHSSSQLASKITEAGYQQPQFQYEIFRQKVEFLLLLKVRVHVPNTGPAKSHATLVNNTEGMSWLHIGARYIAQSILLAKTRNILPFQPLPLKDLGILPIESGGFIAVSLASVSAILFPMYLHMYNCAIIPHFVTT